MIVTPRGARDHALHSVGPALASSHAGTRVRSRKPLAGAASDLTAPVRAPETTPAFDFHPVLAELPEERPLSVELNGRQVAMFLCSPGASRELAVGWAYTQGYLGDRGSLRHISEFSNRVSLMVDDPSTGGELWTHLVASGFASSLVAPPPDDQTPADTGDEARWVMPRDRLLEILGRVVERFRGDGEQSGVHWAAASDGDQVCVVARDIRRSCAVDKVVGFTLLQEIARTELVLCLTGKISADIAFRAWRAGFPIVASFAAPTADAVEFAESAGVTLIGRGKDGRRLVYSHGWRLTDEDDPGVESV
jgi:FdhD protein